MGQMLYLISDGNMKPGVDQSFVRPQAYTIFEALFKKGNTKLCTKVNIYGGHAGERPQSSSFISFIVNPPLHETHTQLLSTVFQQLHTSASIYKVQTFLKPTTQNFFCRKRYKSSDAGLEVSKQVNRALCFAQ